MIHTTFVVLVVFALLPFAYLQTTILASSTSIKIVAPANVVTAAAGSLNDNELNLIPGAIWIWSTAGDTSPIGTQLTFQSLIYLNCGGPLTLTIAAFDDYFVYWDSVSIQNGTNYQTAINVTLKASCGNHNLTIVVIKKVAGSISGLAFLISQNQTSCFTCNANGYWNEQTCSCLCLDSCACTTPKNWTAYPTCACTCPPHIIFFPTPLPLPVSIKSVAAIAAPISDSLIRIAPCPVGQYYSQEQCKCLCHYQYCGSGYYYDDEPAYTCGCKYFIT